MTYVQYSLKRQTFLKIVENATICINYISTLRKK